MASKKPKHGRRCSLKLDLLVLDPTLQSRAGGLDPDHVEDLAEAVRNQQRLPRVRVRKVPEQGHLVVDGFHTVEAYRIVGRTHVPCIISPGVWGDAVLDAASANQQHLGLKRTNADKRHAVHMALLVVPHWSDNRVAGHVGVSDKTVAEERSRLESTSEIPKLTAREGIDGKTRSQSQDAPKTPARTPSGIGRGVEDKDSSLFTDVDEGIAKQTDPNQPAEPPHPFAEIMALVTRLSGMLTTAMKGDGEEAKRLHDYLSWAHLVEHSAGEVIDPSRIEDDGREESTLAFIPLRGARKLIDLAGQPGRKRTQSEIEMIYDKASGGWLPPIALRRRSMKK